MGSWKEWICVSIPCGIVTSGDIGLSNLSMVTISITFYTMCKASTPIFVLFWAYLFGIERITLSLIGVVFIITCGEFLTVIGEVNFDLKGFVLCISAAILSGARWTLIQLKLQTMEPPIKSTIATMKLLAPSMFFTLLSVSFAIETPWVKLGHYTMDEWLHTIELGTVGAFIAISMILCEFYLILYASAMILMIGGVIKEMITIIIGVTYFGDSLNSINVAGCVIVFLGVILYKATRMYDKTQNHNLSSTIDEDEYEVVGSRNPPESPNNNANDDLELTFSSDSFDSQGSATRSRFRRPSISPILSEDPSDSEPLQSSPNGQSSSSPVSNDLNDNEDEIQRPELKIV